MYAPPPGMEKAAKEERHSANRDREEPQARGGKRELTMEEKFPHLKGAPRMPGAVGPDVFVKPFGLEVRNIKCRHCGEWGHRAGDRECQQKDALHPGIENRQRLLDPLTVVNAQTQGIGGGLTLKGFLEADAVHGGLKKDADNQQFLVSDDEDHVRELSSPVTVCRRWSSRSCRGMKRAP